MEVEDVQFFDRAMCLSEDGPYYDERGFVQLNFPDNGYTDFIDPNAVFSLINYEEISRVPPQVSYPKNQFVVRIKIALLIVV